MTILLILPLVLLMAGGIDVVSSENPFEHMTADHLITIHKYCKAHSADFKQYETKIEAEEKQFNAAIKARHGKNAKKMTKDEMEKEEIKAMKTVNYTLVVPRCCSNVEKHLPIDDKKSEKENKKVEAYIKSAETKHKEALTAHMNTKVKGQSEAPPHGDVLFLACAPVECADGKCKADPKKVDEKMGQIHKAKQALRASIKKDKAAGKEKEQAGKQKHTEKKPSKKASSSDE